MRYHNFYSDRFGPDHATISVPRIADYMDKARDALGVTSDRQLSKFLPACNAAINQWRTGRTWPSDVNMIALADLAQCDTAQALVALNFWRSPQTVRPIYERMFSKLLAENKAA